MNIVGTWRIVLEHTEYGARIRKRSSSESKNRNHNTKNYRQLTNVLLVELEDHQSPCQKHGSNVSNIKWNYIVTCLAHETATWGICHWYYPRGKGFDSRRSTALTLTEISPE